MFYGQMAENKLGRLLVDIKAVLKSLSLFSKSVNDAKKGRTTPQPPKIPKSIQIIGQYYSVYIGKIPPRLTINGTLIIADKPISSTYPQRNKKYREAILQQHKSQLQYSLSRIPAKKCFLFWNLALVAVQQNVIYRLLTRSIPSRRYMHQIFPEKFNSAQCQICLSSIESSKHMLFYCPSKANIWKTIISEFLWPTTNISNIIAATFTLNFQPIAYCQKPGLTVQNVILCTLANIWKSHFRSSFNSTPFLWPVVVQQIRAHLSSFQAEGSLQNLL
ncbi:uncharacterized protein EV154DRAFT_554383 [Mucor mucedo]|uniref:uncharacterized protein n=1 Tax=Mucor mucedo TaxID=29922 RepID=UPI00221FB54B|nr:uncharacterized protein EV154DRAFT_554383 [Mucor mucedo]KAI7887777.1 hypothetical protein EV154DRAFT_554383 [Mucor mucedo]